MKTEIKEKSISELFTIISEINQKIKLNDTILNSLLQSENENFNDDFNVVYNEIIILNKIVRDILKVIQFENTVNKLFINLNNDTVDETCSVLDIISLRDTLIFEIEKNKTTIKLLENNKQKNNVIILKLQEKNFEIHKKLNIIKNTLYKFNNSHIIRLELPKDM